MKRIIALLLIAAMCLALCACGGNKKAFEASKAAYLNIDAAYKITEQFGTDIYEAWRLGIYEEDSIRLFGAAYLAQNLSLSADEIRAGVVCSVIGAIGVDWKSFSEEEKKACIYDVIDKADDTLSDRKGDFFSFCVSSIVNAYIISGKAKEAQDALDAAKAQMKELSQKYSDYEHYPNLKNYYTMTSSFFEFCSNPTGSFEQVKDTMNNYKNDARDYISDLDYIFE